MWYIETTLITYVLYVLNNYGHCTGPHVRHYRVDDGTHVVAWFYHNLYLLVLNFGYLLNFTTHRRSNTHL